MTLEDALKMLVVEHKRAKKMEYVKNPLAWALHQVWKIADREGEQNDRNRNADALASKSGEGKEDENGWKGRKRK